MPKLIVNRSKARRKTPPCGRLIHYVEPRSPFQKLVEHRRLELSLSTRGLARELGQLGSASKVSQSTLWIWLHSENGYPHPKSFKPAHLKALATVLKIPVAELQAAIDLSRHVYSPGEVPMPENTRDAFAAFISILDNDRRDNVKRSYVLNLARTIYNGATSPAPLDGDGGDKPRAPKSRGRKTNK